MNTIIRKRLRKAKRRIERRLERGDGNRVVGDIKVVTPPTIKQGFAAIWDTTAGHTRTIVLANGSVLDKSLGM